MWDKENAHGISSAANLNTSNNVPSAIRIAGAPALDPDNKANILIEGSSMGVWPEYACFNLSSTGAIGIKLQPSELQVIIRCAIHKILGWVLFEDSFPSIQTRSQWNKQAMEEASTEFMECAREPMKGRYYTILSRVKIDPIFVRTIGQLVCSRIINFIIY